MGAAIKHKVVTTNCCLSGWKCQRCFWNDTRCLATLRKKEKKFGSSFTKQILEGVTVATKESFKRLDTLRSRRLQNKSKWCTVRPRVVIIGDFATNVVLNKIKKENKETFARLFCRVVGL